MIIKDNGNKEEQLIDNEIEKSGKIKEDEKIPETMTRGETRKRVMNIAWPVLVELFVASLFGMVDMMMLGNIIPQSLSAASIASVGIANQPLFIGLSLVQSFNVGGTAIIARYFGAGKKEKLGNVVKHVMILSMTLIVIPMVILIFSMAPKIMAFLGAGNDVIAVGEDYFKIVHVGFVFQALNMCVNAALRGVGETKVPMKINLFANGLNVIGNAVLIYGLFGFPKLGVTGAGISTALSQFIAMILVYSYILRGKSVIKLNSEKFRMHYNTMVNLIRIGIPASMEQLALRLGIFLYVRIVASLGTAVYAAHQIALSILGLSFNPGMAFGMATSALVGQALGRKKPMLAEESARMARRIGSWISTFMGLIFFFFGRQLVGLYTSDPAIIDAASTALKIIAIVQPFQSSQFILAGGLRGAGDTFWPFLATLVSVLGVRIVLAYVFVNMMGMGLPGAWLAVLVDQFVRWIFVYLRFRSGKWKSVRLK